MQTAMESQYNTRSPAVKRLMREANELKEATHEFFAQPLEDNLFEWHFTVRGPSESEFSDGYYHGRIILPTEYPMKPPSIIMLTPNGRFEVNKKICLSISGHHPESWQPSWSIRTALLAIIGFMPTEGRGAIGSLDYPADERKRLAVKSHNWCCPSCGVISKLLKTGDTVNESADNREAKELAKQICFKGTNSDASAVESNSMPANANSGYESSSSDSPSEVSETAETRNNVENANSGADPVVPEIRQRNVNQQHSAHVSQAAHMAHVANVNLESSSSSSRFITYLIVILSLAIVLLLFRRFFFM